MKVLKDFYRSIWKTYGARDDSMMEVNRKRIDSIVEFNKDYSNKKRIIYGIIEILIIYIITFIVLGLYFPNFNNIYNWTSQIGIWGMFFFIFSLGIPFITLMSAFCVFYDNCINFLSIKFDKEILKKRLILIGILAFIVNFIIYMSMWPIIFNAFIKV